MKKKLILAAACLGLVLTLSACGTTQKSTENGGNPGRHPDFGQPKEQPALRGLVKSIVGNQVVILKLDIPQRNAAASSTGNTASSTKKNSLFSLGGSNGRREGGMGGGMAGGRGNSGGSGSSSSTDRAALIEKMKEMSTGEATVTIPVGIKMLKSDSTNPRTMVEASLADVVADKSITVWLAHSDPKNPDQKIADFVIIN